MEQQLMGFVLTKANITGKIYLTDDKCSSTIPNLSYLEERIQAICAEADITPPDEHINDLETRWFSPPDYGMPRFTDIFTLRQLLALLTFTAQVRHAYPTMLEEGLETQQSAAITT